jgi:hypothetical protein
MRRVSGFCIFLPCCSASMRRKTKEDKSRNCHQERDAKRSFLIFGEGELLFWGFGLTWYQGQPN